MSNHTLPENNDDLPGEMNRIEEMINSPSVRDMRKKNRHEHGYIRPRNAATMILLDGHGDDTRVLMGKRNKDMKFMPGALVFPGGSVDKFDGSVPAVDELSANTQTRLLNSMRGKPTTRGARALGLAAIREVAEESGLLVGKNGDFNCPHKDWKDFETNGIIPSLSGVRLFARAITPPGMARRFDTWFFITRASEVGFTPSTGFAPDGELEDLQWIRPEQAITENTREITRVMLVELIRRLRQDERMDDTYPAPYYHTVGNCFRKKLI